MATEHFTCYKCKKKCVGSGYVYQKRKYCYDCFQEFTKELEKEEKQRQELYQYIKQLFMITEIPVEVLNAISREVNDNKKLSGIKLTLKYYYEIEGNPPNSPTQIIFVIRDFYEEAKKHYAKVREIREHNEQIDLNVPPVTVKLTLDDLSTKNKERFSYNIEDL